MLEKLTKSKYDYLIKSDFLKVIVVAGYRCNLSLSINVEVKHETGECTLFYSVDPWNDNIKRLKKEFANYNDAFEYYQKVYNKFGIRKFSTKP